LEKLHHDKPLFQQHKKFMRGLGSIMILSRLDKPRKVSFLIALLICVALTTALPDNTDAKGRKSSGRASAKSKSGKSSKSKHTGGSKRGSSVARGRGGSRSHVRVARVRVRGRNGRTVWKTVAVAARPRYTSRPASSPSIGGHSAGVHNFLTSSWANAQLTPADSGERMAPVVTTTEVAGSDVSKVNPVLPQSNGTNGLASPSLTDEGLPANPLVAAYWTSLMSRGFASDNQGFIVTTMNGDVLGEHNADRLFNPASVTKVATTLAVLAKVGPNFQFRTNLYTDGALDPTTGTLKGSLYVIGCSDPSFFYENAMLIADQLNRAGIRTIEGNLVVLGQFYFNFSANREASAKALRNAWNPETWNASAKSSYYRFLSMRPLENQRETTAIQPALIIMGETIADPAVNTSNLKLLATHTSLPLIRVLKALNDFSNNWMATMIGNLVGGPDAVQRVLEQEVGFTPEDLNIATASGLGSNQISPRGTIKMMRKLATYLAKYNLGFEDILPIAGIDAGTLQRRFGDAFRGSVVGKTGTLSGVSALAGVMNTRSKGQLLFVIYNRGGSVASFRNAQDETIKKIITLYGGPLSVKSAPQINPSVNEREQQANQAPGMRNK
jgi:serine-type D-Ala-D-Ala carboxypeptidase/endopeptidase (penicillin-binding protein 4)